MFIFSLAVYSKNNKVLSLIRQCLCHLTLFQMNMTKLKAFADDILNAAKMMIYLFE